MGGGALQAKRKGDRENAEEHKQKRTQTRMAKNISGWLTLQEMVNVARDDN